MTTDLPAYVVERNRKAKKAGLSVAQLEVQGTKLITRYIGDEQAWRRSPFYHRAPDKPFPRTFGGPGFECFSPSGHRGREFLTMAWQKDGALRGTIKEHLPEWVELLGAGIEAYSYPTMHGAPIVYLGDPMLLIKRKIAPPEILNGKAWARADDGEWLDKPIIWEVEILSNKRCWFADFVGNREAYAEKKAEQARRPYEAPGDLIRDWSATSHGILKTLTDEYRRVENKKRETYTVAKESLEAIDDAIAEFLDVVRNVRVIVRSPDGDKPKQLAASVRADAAFQAFMASATSRNYGAEGGACPSP